MRIIDRVPELRGLLADADHVDVREAESGASLREFVAGAMGRNPAWMRGLFRARGVLGRVLRLREPDIPIRAVRRPEELSFAPGDRVAFFTVRDASEDRFVVLEASDNHLSCWLAMAREPAADGRARFEMATIVKYHRWTGPVYFAVIRPFHHLIVAGMARSGARGPSAARAGGVDRWVPRLLLAIAAGHVAIGLVDDRARWRGIVSEGLWNTVSGDDDARRAGLWFMLGGIALGGLAVLMRRSVIATGALPPETGWILLSAAVPICVLEPASGAWALLPLGGLALWASRRDHSAGESSGALEHGEPAPSQ
ncbi:DUF6463 family protein [Actinomadura chibensis]|uniref:DUF6463 family protein n=1 Tax=Actinomadura chibensis TaxID=392828 RepID=UPI00082DF798|nr:DUF6463 family protein [Actinomadura chibensis]